ncbi:MAG: hypothetical protein WCZ85_01515 [Bacilli bacterium]
MVVSYDYGKDFFSDNEKILLSDELEYGMAIHNAKILRDYKLDEKNYALKITADGGVLLAIRSGDYPMALAGSPAGVDELVLEIDRRGLVFTDILGASDITAAFIAVETEDDPELSENSAPQILPPLLSPDIKKSIR